ncbi:MULTISPECIES: capsule biosynthesis protein [Achromobacter]|uniref:Capsule biosynthesis protein CapA n=1 Tax=Achromobacter spanius TaxID=217203 RepID=A0ABY8GXP6_9BURK|nr:MULTISPECIES: capsule biosynthesis protein CapA [Achromobacter]WAI81357.1 capsule biosynthesis protein CapA [Achromobacter spanius]WEX96875.1 capsule biosynthesis protein CapA [Achromobacter sp. SS2-2022]WFP09410.1 capsule biosynthesis protein CapA [Achromobacter spanius]
MSSKQRFLFLQGVCSPFFPALAKGLQQAGCSVRKVNFTVGDRVYWRQGLATSFQGAMSSLTEFYRKEFERYGISDVVLFGDCRPVHQPAVALAKQTGVRVHVFEEGYFRPYWITLERGGVNGHSSMPKDPMWYREEARSLPQFDNGSPFSSPFWKRAAYDVGYNFWAGINPILHRGVRSHIPYSPLTEYIGYAKRGIRVKCYEMPSRKIEAMLISESKNSPFFLMPLQLATDAQIVHHSPFADMLEAMYVALASFARHAPSHSRFAVKIHPLDPGLVNYKKHLYRWAKEFDLTQRVFYLESGNLPALLTHTAGLVTVNSTVGGSSLLHARPTIALGSAIYNIAGLTFQTGLNEFWRDADAPDTNLFKCFRNVVIAKTQINGGFYSAPAIKLAVENSVPRLLKKPELLDTPS